MIDPTNRGLNPGLTIGMPEEGGLNARGGLAVYGDRHVKDGQAGNFEMRRGNWPGFAPALGKKLKADDADWDKLEERLRPALRRA